MRMSDAARTANGVAPSVPHRNGVTVRVKTDGDGDDAKSAKGSHTPSGSHRVLLKLRRMSGGGGSSSRPKSVSDASEIPGGAAETPGNSSQNPGNGGVAGSRMRNSRSMHQMFHYNKTWNERSLSKCLREEGQHNYENIYSGDKDTANEESDFNPLYENVGYPQYSQYPFVSLGNPIHDEGGSLVIGQLTKSPRSTARSRRKPQVQNTSNGNSGNSNNGLFRSKSCERPKMRDAVRETQQHLVSNFNRLLHNRFGVGGHSSSSNNNNDNSGSSAMTSSASMFMGGDNSSGYKSFHSGTDDLQPQSHCSLNLSASLASASFDDSQSLLSSEFGGAGFVPGGPDAEENKSIQSGTSGSTTTALNVVNRMRGIRNDVQKKISRLRSRSAERISQRSLTTDPRSCSTHLRESGADEDSRVWSSATTTEGGGRGLLLPPRSPIATAKPAEYTGPFIGRARALVDYTPSPYDRDALRFKRGDLLEIISMNPSGLWKGKCATRVGNFKFINVEILPEKPSNVFVNDQNSVAGGGAASARHGARRRRGRTKGRAAIGNERPKTVEELLTRIGLEDHISVFVLNGYEDLESFEGMDEAELDYLGITSQAHRAKLMAAVELLHDAAALYSGEDSDPEISGVVTDRLTATADGDDEHDSLEGNGFGTNASSPTGNASTSSCSVSGNAFRRLSFPRDSGCFASNENLNKSSGTLETHKRASPAASDRSSHSGVSSHPESGIHTSSTGSRTAAAVTSSDEEQAATGVKSRSAEQAAKARSLRDRRTVNVEELEEATSHLKTGLRIIDPRTELRKRQNLSHSETMELIHARRYQDLHKSTTVSPATTSTSTLKSSNTATSSASSFDALIEKYGKTKNSPSTVPNFESQFMSAKSVFERRLSEAAAAATAATAESSTAKSASATTSPVKRLDTCRKFAATLVDQQR